MSPSSDAWQNEAARDLLVALADRGLEVTVAVGRLHVTPADQLTDEDVAVITAHRDALRVLVLACDTRTLERLAGMQAGQLERGAPVPGRCDTCRAELPAHRALGSCGWCRVAGVQFAHWRVTDALARTGAVPPELAMQAQAAVLSPRLLGLFPSSISGITSSLLEEARDVA